MNEMKLYRALQTHVGNINSLVVKLYKGEITASQALSEAKVENGKLTKEIQEIEDKAAA